MVRVGLFILALGINVILFLTVPAIQILSGIQRPYTEKPERRVERQVDIWMPHEEKRQEKPIHELKTLVEPMPKLVSPLKRQLKIELSVAGASAASMAAGGSKGGALGGTSQVGGGTGVVDYLPGQTDTDAGFTGHPGDPDFPPRARREGVQGFVMLGFVVNEQGYAEQITILQEEPSGYGFGREATKWLRSKRFKPATLNQVPVRQKLRQAVDFKIR